MTEDSRLDGNAAAGLLSELFTAEATAAEARCPGCEAVLMRFARIRGRLVADLRGVVTLTF